MSYIEDLIWVLFLVSCALTIVLMIVTVTKSYIAAELELCQCEEARGVRPEAEKDFVLSLDDVDKHLSCLAKCILSDLARNYGIGLAHFRQCFTCTSRTRVFKHRTGKVVLQVIDGLHRELRVVICPNGRDYKHDIRININFAGLGHIYYREGERCNFTYDRGVITRFHYHPQTSTRILSQVTVDNLRMMARIPKRQFENGVKIG